MHAYQKAGALVSRSHHHQQQSMNKNQAMFMNILLSCYLSLSTFFLDFRVLSLLCNLQMFLPHFIFLCFTLLLWCLSRPQVLYDKGVTNGPKSQKPLACQSLRSMTVLQRSHRETADEVLFREFFCYYYYYYYYFPYSYLS